MYDIGSTYFDEYFLFYGITGKHLFVKVYRYSEIFFNRHVAASFGTNVLKEVRVLDYIHNNNTVLISKFTKATVYYTCKDLF